MTDLPVGTVTFLFTDIEGSTRLLEQAADAYATMLADHRRILRAAFKDHGGTEVDTQGDAFFVSFSRARDALQSAAQGQRALAEHAWPEDLQLRVRMGLHTGEPLIANSGYVGIDVHRAARIAHVAHGGQVLLSPSTTSLVSNDIPDGLALTDLGSHRLKDLRHPIQIHQLDIAGLSTSFPPLRTLDSIPNNLPLQPTSFVGRTSEIEEIMNLLAEARLVTMAGPGGTGKTRLALQVAAESLDQHEDGVFFVDLTLLNDPQQVVSHVAGTLGVGELGTEPLINTLERFLKGKQILLVLDNFEHLIEAAPTVSELISAGTKLHVLITSREPLRLSAESTYMVPPLRLPEPEQGSSVEDFERNEAVQLFVRRARAAVHGFHLTEDNAQEIVTICRGLDGLPLAIELASARVRLFPPKKLVEQLQDQLKLLRGGPRDLPARQQTLRHTIDWSYDLLDESERALFSRLAAFSGGATLEAIETVCGDGLGADILDTLESLLDKSLIRRLDDSEGQPRFGMLETIQAYASERLAERGDWQATWAAHAQWVLEFAERAEEGLFGEAWEAWAEQIRAEEGNIRVTIERCKRGQVDPELGVRLAGKLRYYWETVDKLTEGRASLEAMLSVSEDAPPGARAAAVCGAGVLAYWQGDLASCGSWCTQAVALAEQIGDRLILGEAQHFLGHYAQNEGDQERGLELLDESLDNFQALDHPWGIRRSKNCLADAERLTQNYDRAARSFRELIDSHQGTAKDVLYGATLSNYGNVLNRQGEYRAAQDSFHEGIQFAWELENATLLGYMFGGLAGTAVLSGQPQEAARLMGACEKAFEEAGVTSMNAIDQFDHDYYMAALQGELGEESLGALMETGRQMSLEEAVRFALATVVTI